MQDAYSKSLLTVIAVALCAITAKLYLPMANRIGPHVGAPTRGDLAAARTSSSTNSSAEMRQLKLDVPLSWIDGGDVEVSGSVSVDQPVEVTGSVSIDGPVEIEQ